MDILWMAVTHFNKSFQTPTAAYANPRLYDWTNEVNQCVVIKHD